MIDFILNVAGLLLWLNWRAVRPVTTMAAGMAGAPGLRRADPPGVRWWCLAGLLALLSGRAVFYWLAGSRLNWAPAIPLSGTTLLFRSDLPDRMLLFSVLSFGATLGFFYLCLLLLSVINMPAPDADLAQRLVRRHLGRLDRWPGAMKLLLPLPVMTALWCALNPLLFQIGMVPRVPPWHLLAQGAEMGLAAYFALKYLVAGFLILYVLNSYVYLGDFAFLKFVNTTVCGLLRPLRRLPLRIGRVNLAPLAGLALVMLAAEFGRRGLDQLYR